MITLPWSQVVNWGPNACGCFNFLKSKNKSIFSPGFSSLLREFERAELRKYGREAPVEESGIWLLSTTFVNYELKCWSVLIENFLTSLTTQIHCCARAKVLGCGKKRYQCCCSFPKSKRILVPLRASLDLTVDARLGLERCSMVGSSFINLSERRKHVEHEISWKIVLATKGLTMQQTQLFSGMFLSAQESPFRFEVWDSKLRGQVKCTAFGNFPRISTAQVSSELSWEFCNNVPKLSSVVELELFLLSVETFSQASHSWIFCGFCTPFAGPKRDSTPALLKTRRKPVIILAYEVTPLKKFPTRPSFSVFVTMFRTTMGWFGRKQNTQIN